MKKSDIKEAAPLLARTMQALLAEVYTHEIEGANVRRAVGYLLAHAPEFLRDDVAGEPTADCFDAAVSSGMTYVSFGRIIIATTALETPITLGGILTKNCLIEFGLNAVSRVLADATFESRQDVDRVRTTVNSLFSTIEEKIADDKDFLTYRLLITLHAALNNHLITVARPLPRLVRFHFARPLPTLVASYRLYDDASRGDELRAENKVVHPAFMRHDGLALST